MLRQIVLDTETTGLDPKYGHRIIEVGCLELINRQITGDTFHRYINPQRDIEQSAIDVHGLTAEFLSDKPVFSQIAAELRDYIRDAELIIHNAPFDIGFLNYEYKLLSSEKYPPVTDYCKVIDTLVMARRKYPGQHNNLDALCKRLTVDNTNRDLHGALIDAELLAQVYLLMTGGQTELLLSGQEATGQATTDNSIKRLDSNRPPLAVIKATAEELQAHQEYMQMLSDN